jgi:hypothetical protein
MIYELLCFRKATKLFNFYQSVGGEFGGHKKLSKISIEFELKVFIIKQFKF